MPLRNRDLSPVDGLRVERLGPGSGAAVLVSDPNRALVHRLDGRAGRCLEAVIRGESVPDDEVSAGLIAAGIVTAAHGAPDSARDGAIDRRRALTIGAGAAAVGITTVLLPNAAAAASVSGPDGDGSPGTLTVRVDAANPGDPESYRRFTIFWAWDGATSGSPYSYTIDPAIASFAGSQTGSASVDFNTGRQFTYDTASNSGSRVITASWFGVTRVITIPDIQTVAVYSNP
jgi:hypothetical protein